MSEETTKHARKWSDIGADDSEDDFVGDLEEHEEPKVDDTEKLLTAIKEKITGNGPFVLMVSNMPDDKKEEDVRSIFEKCNIKKYEALPDKEHKGIFKINLEVDTVDDVAYGMLLLNTNVDGRRLSVAYKSIENIPVEKNDRKFHNNERRGERNDYNKRGDNYRRDNRNRGNNDDRRDNYRGNNYKRDNHYKRDYSDGRNNDRRGGYRRQGDDDHATYSKMNLSPRTIDRSNAPVERDEKIFGSGNPREENIAHETTVDVNVPVAAESTMNTAAETVNAPAVATSTSTSTGSYDNNRRNDNHYKQYSDRPRRHNDRKNKSGFKTVPGKTPQNSRYTNKEQETTRISTHNTFGNLVSSSDESDSN